MWGKKVKLDALSSFQQLAFNIIYDVVNLKNLGQRQRGHFDKTLGIFFLVDSESPV